VPTLARLLGQQGRRAPRTPTPPRSCQSGTRTSGQNRPCPRSGAPLSPQHALGACGGPGRPSGRRGLSLLPLGSLSLQAQRAP
jgi:hypothetical protein